MVAVCDVCVWRVGRMVFAKSELVGENSCRDGTDWQY
jgi:hypothetical protein